MRLLNDLELRYLIGQLDRETDDETDVDATGTWLAARGVDPEGITTLLLAELATDEDIAELRTAGDIESEAFRDELERQLGTAGIIGLGLGLKIAEYTQSAEYAHGPIVAQSDVLHSTGDAPPTEEAAE